MQCVCLCIACIDSVSVIARTSCIHNTYLLGDVLTKNYSTNRTTPEGFRGPNTNSTTGNCKQPHTHDDVIKWKHFPRHWPFVRGINRSPVNSPRKGQWRGALMFSLICVWIKVEVNNREAGDLRPYRAHYDVTIMGTRSNNWMDDSATVCLKKPWSEQLIQSVQARYNTVKSNTILYAVRQWGSQKLASISQKNLARPYGQSVYGKYCEESGSC